MSLSIIVPAHNEEKNIEEVINAIENKVSIDHEIVVVDDHSTDRTAEVVMKLALNSKNNIHLVNNNDVPGFANALKTGLKNAKSDFLVPVMADLCDDPETINKMYEKIQQGYDIVCGSRYMKQGRKIGGPKIKSFFSWFVSKTLKIFVGFPAADISNSFKMYRKKLIENIDIKSKGFEISVELPLKAFLYGYKITEVPTVWVDRKEGESKFSVFKQGTGYITLYLWGICKKILH